MNPFQYLNEAFGIGYEGDLRAPWEKAHEMERIHAAESDPKKIADLFGAECEQIARTFENNSTSDTFASVKEVGANALETGINLLQVVIVGFRAAIALLPDENSRKVEMTLKKVADLIKKYIPSFEKLGDAFSKDIKPIGKDVDEATDAMAKKDLNSALNKISEALDKVKKLFDKNNTSSKKEAKESKKSDEKAKETKDIKETKKSEKSDEKVADTAAADQATVNVPFAGSNIPEWMQTGLGSMTPSDKTVPDILTANGVGEKIPPANPIDQVFAPVPVAVEPQQAANMIPDEVVKKYYLDKIVEIAASVGVSAGCQIIKDTRGNDALIMVSAISKIGAYIPDKSFAINMVPVIDYRTGIWPCATNDPCSQLPLELCNAVYSIVINTDKEKDGKKIREKIFNKDLIENIFKFGFSGLPEDTVKKNSILFSNKIMDTNRRFVMASIPQTKDREKSSQVKGAIIRATAGIAKWEAGDGFGYGRFILKDFDEKSMCFTMANNINGSSIGYFLCPPPVGVTPLELKFTPKLKDGKFIYVKEGKSDIEYDIELIHTSVSSVA